MKFGVTLAIFVSVISIGFASWYRFFAPQTISNVGTLQQVGVGGTYTEEDLLQNFLEPNTDIATAPNTAEEELSNTDIVSRNIILSYLDLATSGRTVNTESIQGLAAQYANSIVGFHKFDKAEIQDIIIVPDSITSAKSYAYGFSQVYAKYSEQIQAIFGNQAALSQSNNSYKPFIEPFLAIYEGMASGFKTVPVPISLSQLHLEIVNGYLSNAQAMKSVRTLETDPITAMAGLTALGDNINKELEILKSIDKILQDKWGIM